MSRSNPTENQPHPAKRWFEWDGANGLVRYYDKEAKKNIDVGDDVVFILLDELSTIKGWHDDSESSIYANEVKDTTQEAFVVKAFKAKGILAEGMYRQIRDKVGAMGASFTANLYIGVKINKVLTIASLMLKGSALSAWVEFRKANRGEVYKKAVRIKGSVSGKKGKVEFKTPKFSIFDISTETDEEAKGLDTELQAYLKAYFTRTRVEQVDQRVPVEHEGEEPENRRYDDTPDAEPTSDRAPSQRRRQDADDAPVEDDIPF